MRSQSRNVAKDLGAHAGPARYPRVLKLVSIAALPLVNRSHCRRDQLFCAARRLGTRPRNTSKYGYRLVLHPSNPYQNPHCQVPPPWVSPQRPLERRSGVLSLALVGSCCLGAT